MAKLYWGILEDKESYYNILNLWSINHTYYYTYYLCTWYIRIEFIIHIEWRPLMSWNILFLTHNRLLQRYNICTSQLLKTCLNWLMTFIVPNFPLPCYHVQSLFHAGWVLFQSRLFCSSAIGFFFFFMEEQCVLQPAEPWHSVGYTMLTCWALLPSGTDASSYH